MSAAVSDVQHRASRSGRCVAATGLIAAMAVLTTIALLSGSATRLVLVADLLLAVAAAALLHSVVVATRHRAAQERAEISARVASQNRRAAIEHVAFVEILGHRLDVTRAEAVRLGARSRELEARLVHVEAELAQARTALEHQPRHVRTA